MNVIDGTLEELLFGEESNLPSNSIPVSNSDMTKKQKKEKKVSLHDRKSKLGRQLTDARKKRKLGVNDPCSCGSGKKYKKCCLPTTKIRFNKRKVKR